MPPMYLYFPLQSASLSPPQRKPVQYCFFRRYCTRINGRFTHSHSQAPTGHTLRYMHPYRPCTPVQRVYCYYHAKNESLMQCFAKNESLMLGNNVTVIMFCHATHGPHKAMLPQRPSEQYCRCYCQYFAMPQCKEDNNNNNSNNQNKSLKQSFPSGNRTSE